MTTHEKLPEAIQSFGDRVAELMAEHGIESCLIFPFAQNAVSYRVLAYDAAEGRALQVVAEMVLRDIEVARDLQSRRLMGEVAGHG